VAPSSEWLFFPGLPKWSPETVPVWTPGSLGVCNFLLRPPIGMMSKATYRSLQELSNAMSHSSYRRWNRVDSRLLVVGSQTVSLIPGPSFAHNLGCICPNGSCEAILDIYTSRPFQRHKEHFNARCFDPCNQALSF
jgi:hypothetical protein